MRRPKNSNDRSRSELIAAFSDGALASTNASTLSATSPDEWPTTIDSENHGMFWLRTSLSMTVASRRDASLE